MWLGGLNRNISDKGEMMPTQIEDMGLKKIFSLKKGHETARTVE